MTRRLSRALAAVLAVSASWHAAAGQEPPRTPPTWPGLKRSGEVLLPNGWSIKPAGRQSPLGDFPILIAECPTEPVLAVLHAGYGDHEVVTVNPADGKVIGRAVIPETFGGLAWSKDGETLYVGGGFDDVIYRFDHKDGLLGGRTTLRISQGERGRKMPAGLALADDERTLWVASAFGHSVVKLDLERGEVVQEIATGPDSYPFGVVVDDPRGRVYVSLWNRAQVAVIDAKTGEITGRYATQEHPNEMLLARQGNLLFVANANRNTVSVIDTEDGRAIETIGTAIAPDAPSGSTPNSLALTPDGSILFVANANTNDVAAVNVETPGQSRPLGLIPVGWYPTSVRVSKDGKSLYVANGKGGSSWANRDGPRPTIPGGDSKLRQYIAGLLRGTLSTIPMPDPARMAAYTRTVYECSPLDRESPARVTLRGRPQDSPIPARVGDPSPIKYCVYIIKENRTYDQVLGDMPQGNGDEELCLFPERVTPNHHALARQFVLLDNFYVESEVSADGHEWSLAAYATDFVERTWPLSYRGDRRVPYPAEGNLAIARPAGGYLWDRAKDRGVSYFSFGEFIRNPARRGEPATTSVETLQGHFDPFFWGYDLDVTDQVRADRFLEVLGQWEREGEMPRLVILRLPNDHTQGTRVGKPTPTAYLADNDLALGRVVEGLSRSRFWPALAIFVVEDDAQNGSDHVDAHRTVALAISPYIKRETVDSTMYSTSSMLRTIELILGLDPMSQFDAAARPMWNSFTGQPDLRPYTALPARVNLRELNDQTAWGAEASEKLDLSREDAADDIVFNEIIWKSVKGADSPMPAPVRAAFVIPRAGGQDDDDDDD
jgi:YVTN family beta-propeller protein